MVEPAGLKPPGIKSALTRSRREAPKSQQTPILGAAGCRSQSSRDGAVDGKNPFQGLGFACAFLACTWIIMCFNPLYLGGLQYLVETRITPSLTTHFPPNRLLVVAFRGYINDQCE
jgi:hypothetical protein